MWSIGMSFADSGESGNPSTSGDITVSMNINVRPKLRVTRRDGTLGGRNSFTVSSFVSSSTRARAAAFLLMSRT
jgi:hypothetical protein